MLADPPALGRFLDDLPTESAGPILAGAVEVLSVDAATAVLEAAWRGASLERRKQIAPLVADLIDRAQEAALDRGPDEGLPGSLLGRFLGALERDEPPPLLPEAQAEFGKSKIR